MVTSKKLKTMLVYTAIEVLLSAYSLRVRHSAWVPTASGVGGRLNNLTYSVCRVVNAGEGSELEKA